ncbi:dihydrofolate reductase, partial [Polaribacter sp.]|nr:dihydrofolate reductase [Polaribacter sp.]
FIIGGAQIYKETIAKNLAQQLDITFVHKDFEADVYFPEIDPKIWKEVVRENFEADEKNKLDYSFISYQKI